MARSSILSISLHPPPGRVSADIIEARPGAGELIAIARELEACRRQLLLDTAEQMADLQRITRMLD